jgi:endoglucanase
MNRREGRSTLFSIILSMILLTNLNAQLTPEEAVAQMQRGINMGNTLEPPLEGGWNNPPAEEVYFDLYQEAGFDVVRIPVRWDEHTSESSPYIVDETWMDRVEQVVDWGLSRDLFVVLNTHHEEWIKSEYDNPLNRARFDSIWSQVANRFRDKPEKLIFEIINEPKGLTMEQNNELHQRVLNIIRLTNPTRNVIVQGHEWGGADELITMTIPDDPYLIGSFHSYDPWPFGLEGTGTFGSAADLQTLENKFIKVKNWSNTSGVPIFLGEFACHRDADYNSRMKHYRAYVNLALKYGFTFCSWDDGGNFQVMLRNSRTWNEIKDILIYCDEFSPIISSLSVKEDTLISLEWSNGTYVYDSIRVERKDQLGTFQIRTTLPPGTKSWVDASAEQKKNYIYRIIAYESGGTPRHSHPLTIYLPEYLVPVRDYYLGQPLPVPGIIEAEDFDLGGEGLSYHDKDDRNSAGAYRPDESVDIYDINGEAFYIGNAMPGEWLEYSIDVEQEGFYSVDVFCSSIYSGGKFLLSIGDVSSDTMEVPSSDSWVLTDTTSLGLSLNMGEQIMRFTLIAEPQFFIDRFEFTFDSTVSGYSTTKKQDLLVHQEIGGDLVISHENQIEILQVFDLNGMLVAAEFNPDPIHHISGTSLKTGIYMILARSGQHVYRKKIYLQK